MARIRAISGEKRKDLTAGWEFSESPSGRWTMPEQADSGGTWLSAIVPGTVAGSLEALGAFDRHAPRPLHDSDFWYRVQLSGAGRQRLHFDGLATLCDIWLDGGKVGTSRSMFQPLALDVDLSGESVLHLHFKALVSDNLPAAARRQRWRPHLIADPTMRLARSALFGHMPGWCPDIDPVGPWRNVVQISPGPLRASDAQVHAALVAQDGRLDVSIRLDGADEAPILSCAGRSAPMQPTGDGCHKVRLRIPGVDLWWPHTHGTPHLHPVTITVGTSTIDLGRVGFRSIDVDRAPDGNGFALIINGERLFCRGANWTTPDIVRLPQDEAAYRPLLDLARDAGMNMLRVSGIMAGESDAFFDLLDDYGILCWEESRLANFDYAFDDADFSSLVNGEIWAFLDRTQTSPALAVMGGGSEIAQQAAMLGLPRERWGIPFLEAELPQIVARWRSDVAVVPHSPWGGDLPFAADAGVTHYYGVGAYCRPLEDARRANVRFATECLAFANLPQPGAMNCDHPGLDPASAEWKQRVVRDLKAGWDFEDSRDFYLDLLYGEDSASLKRSDPSRYIALSQAVSGEVMEATFAEWRRAGSTTAGGLVWFLSDVSRAFGWGVIDWKGRPKPAYYALKRAFRPVTVVMTDEGVNGLHLHAINDTPQPIAARLTLTCIAADGSTVIDGARDLDLPPRTTQQLSATDLFGQFFDASYAYRFGPPAHVASIARLVSSVDPDSTLAEAFHFPLGRGLPHAELLRSMRGLAIPALPETMPIFDPDPGLSARLDRDQAGWLVRLSAQRLAQSVHVDCPGYQPDDDWFHLAPGIEKLVRLRSNARSDAERSPAGTVKALWGSPCVTL